MRPQRLAFLTIPTLLALGLLLPATSSAQEPHFNYSIGLMGGFGGSTDAEPDVGYDNFGFEAFFSMETQLRTKFVVRLGQMAFETGFNTANVANQGIVPFDIDVDLNYATLSGEYKYTDSGYIGGLFIGLGFYELDSSFYDENSLGVTVGTTGDVRLTDRLSLHIQLSGHYADLDYAQFFLMGHVGLAFHF